MKKLLLILTLMLTSRALAMEGFLKLSTNVDVTVLMISSTDHLSGKTGLSGFTVYASKAGGAAGVITPTITQLSSANMPGIYKVAFTTAHTNVLGEFAVHITASGADPCDVKWQIQTYLPGEGINVVAIDGLATNGNYATLNLKKLNIINDSGDALVAKSTSTSGVGIHAEASATDGKAMTLIGDIDGLFIQVASESGDGIGINMTSPTPLSAAISAQLADTFSAAMTTNGYTDTRAIKLDHLDADISDVGVISSTGVVVAGPGADVVTLNITQNSLAVPYASVWVTTDAAGHNTIAGTLTTDVSGHVTFLLDAGSQYYLWMRKTGYKSITGRVFTAEAD